MTQFFRAAIVELRSLWSFSSSQRPWAMPLEAAGASGLPVFIGVWYGDMAAGLGGSLCGLLFLYLPAPAFPIAWPR